MKRCVVEGVKGVESDDGQGNGLSLLMKSTVRAEKHEKKKIIYLWVSKVSSEGVESDDMIDGTVWFGAVERSGE